MWLLANNTLPGQQLVLDRQLADFVVVNASLLRALSLFFRSAAGADAGAASEPDRHQTIWRWDSLVATRCAAAVAHRVIALALGEKILGLERCFLAIKRCLPHAIRIIHVYLVWNTK
jgi:hypothetical protein